MISIDQQISSQIMSLKDANFIPTILYFNCESVALFAVVASLVSYCLLHSILHTFLWVPWGIGANWAIISTSDGYHLLANLVVGIICLRFATCTATSQLAIYVQFFAAVACIYESASDHYQQKKKKKSMCPPKNDIPLLGFISLKFWDMSLSAPNLAKNNIFKYSDIFDTFL